MKTAITLLLTLAVVSIAGTVIQQNPIPEMYIRQHGELTYKVFNALDLFDLYHSKWYSLLLTLIGISLTVCSIRRFNSTWQRAFRPRVIVSSKQIAGMQRTETYSDGSSPQDAAARVETLLRSRSYHVLKEQDGEDFAIHAARGRVSLWGPYLTHLSILVVFAGAVFGSRMGFDGFVRIPEGGSAEKFYLSETKQQALGFRVALSTFTVDQDEAGNPTAYRSDLTIYDGGRPAARKVIGVNHPLTYKGISFFQSTYGRIYKVTVTDRHGKSASAFFYVHEQEGSEGKEYITENPFGQVRIGGEKLTVFIHSLVGDRSGGLTAQLMINDRFPEYKGLDAWTKLGWVTSKEAGYKGFRVRGEAGEYTGLQVAKNPGLPVVYSGFGLMLLAVFAAFYTNHRTIRVRVSPSKRGASISIGAVSRGDQSVFDEDFDSLRGVI